MPRARITNVHFEQVEVTSTEELTYELKRIEAAAIDLLPAMESGDDDTADEAHAKYERLREIHESIVNLLPRWNEAVKEDNRKARKTLVHYLHALRDGSGSNDQE